LLEVGPAERTADAWARYAARTAADEVPAVVTPVGAHEPAHLVAVAHQAAAVQQQFQQGKTAMSNYWASRVKALEDPKESKVIGKIATAAAPAAGPARVGSGSPRLRIRRRKRMYSRAPIRRVPLPA